MNEEVEIVNVYDPPPLFNLYLYESGVSDAYVHCPFTFV
jgi:hypothetical protein